VLHFVMNKHQVPWAAHEAYTRNLKGTYISDAFYCLNSIKINVAIMQLQQGATPRPPEFKRTFCPRLGFSQYFRTFSYGFRNV
jgi:hypothetical protein